MNSTLDAAEAGCPFCKMVMHVVLGGEGIEQIGASGVYHFEPLNPVTPGHRLFIPAFHYEHAAEAPSATGAVFEWAAYWAAERGEDFNLIVNAGSDASQTVPHLHVHYVPRRPGDGLVLPWTNQPPASSGENR
ncbi:HIT family protein [Microbacterium sp. NPDC089696]|uniref:HIT family protein n=1 Tax=Microbacterium sp. NPDC089696 TaxID=3364199 RepID=UPI0037FD9F01